MVLRNNPTGQLVVSRIEGRWIKCLPVLTPIPLRQVVGKAAYGTVELQVIGGQFGDRRIDHTQRRDTMSDRKVGLGLD